MGLVEDIVAARDFVYVPTAGGQVTLDCSTAARKLAANTYLHDHLTENVREEDQRESCAISRARPASISKGHGARR